MKLCIPQATEQGYIEVEPNGAFDFAYPTSKTRRGRVQMGGAVTPTITCAGAELIYVYEVIFDEKDNLIMEAKIQEGEIVLKKERTSPTKPKGKGWEEVITEDGRRAWVRLRKLTPRECLRLMDVDEKNIDKMCSAGISDSQLYKMAGNSIVVACMEKMFLNLFGEQNEEPADGQLTLF